MTARGRQVMSGAQMSWERAEMPGVRLKQQTEKQNIREPFNDLPRW